uniref:Uncharacterized protein n=1 Tax=Setaria digitata TaxID=48799 RepID=A0A915Q790_9BILA
MIAESIKKYSNQMIMEKLPYGREILQTKNSRSVTQCLRVTNLQVGQLDIKQTRFAETIQGNANYWAQNRTRASIITALAEDG